MHGSYKSRKRKMKSFMPKEKYQLAGYLMNFTPQAFRHFWAFFVARLADSIVNEAILRYKNALKTRFHLALFILRTFVKCCLSSSKLCRVNLFNSVAHLEMAYIATSLLHNPFTKVFINQQFIRDYSKFCSKTTENNIVFLILGQEKNFLC